MTKYFCSRCSREMGINELSHIHSKTIKVPENWPDKEYVGREMSITVNVMTFKDGSKCGPSICDDCAWSLAGLR